MESSNLLTWILIILISGTLLPLILIVCVWLYSLRFPVESLRGSLPYQPHDFDEPRFVGLSVPGSIALDDLPGFVLIALLLHEDDRFMVHRGFNGPEMWRAVRRTLSFKMGVRGGSSISQQLVKLVFLRRHRKNFFRYYLLKLVEFPLTIRLEKLFTKQEILTIYVNCVRLSTYVEFGFREGALHFFKKDIREIELVEAMWLLGIIPAPARSENNVRIKGDASYFRFENAASKLEDLIRICASKWGWPSIENISQIPALEALEVMKAYSGVMADLPPAFHLAAKVKSRLLLQELRRLVATFALEARLWVGDFAPDPGMFEKFSLDEE